MLFEQNETANIKKWYVNLFLKSLEMLRGNYYLESWLVKTIIIGWPTSWYYALSKYQQQPWMIILFKRTMKTSSSHRKG